MSWTGGFFGVSVGNEDRSVTSEFVCTGGGLTSVIVVVVWSISEQDRVSISDCSTSRDGGEVTTVLTCPVLT